MVFLAAFVLSLFRGPKGSREGEAAAKSSAASRLGIFVQMLGFGWTGIGPIRIAYNGIDLRFVGEGLLLAMLCALVLTIFLLARTALAELLGGNRGPHSTVQGHQP